MIFWLFTVLPVIAIVPFAMLNKIPGLSANSAIILLLVIVPLAIYYFISAGPIKNEMEKAIIRIGYYINFIIYMIATLISFNLLVIGGFLFTGLVPMGMQLDPNNAIYLVLLGIYILLTSSIGMWYLSFSKKWIRSI